MASTVWYALTLPTAAQVQVDTAGSDFDTAVVVFTGEVHEDLHLVGCANDRGDVLQASLSFSAQAGVTYLVQVGAAGELPDGLGALHIDFLEAARPTGKPTVDGYRTADQAALAFWAEEIPGWHRWVKVTAASTASQRRPGAPELLQDIEVMVRESVAVGDVRHNDEWFGFIHPDGELRLDPSLQTATITAQVALEHTRLISRGPDDADPEIVELPDAVGLVDLTFTGVGRTLRDNHTFRDRGFSERSHVVFTEHVRFADVTGGVTVDGRSVIDGPPWQAVLLRSALHETLWHRS
jgi:hypothetical protein